MSTIKINRRVIEYPPNGELIIDVFPPFFEFLSLFDLSPIAILVGKAAAQDIGLSE